jgi:hypothetical protein
VYLSFRTQLEAASTSVSTTSKRVGVTGLHFATPCATSGQLVHLSGVRYRLPTHNHSIMRTKLPRAKLKSRSLLWALFFVGISVLCVVLVVRSRFTEPGWISAAGTVRETRIVPSEAQESRYGARLTWEALYTVCYVVNGHEYNTEADSGIRGGSEVEVQVSASQIHPTCLVRYNPAKPQIAVATCR